MSGDNLLATSLAWISHYFKPVCSGLQPCFTIECWILLSTNLVALKLSTNCKWNAIKAMAVQSQRLWQKHKPEVITDTQLVRRLHATTYATKQVLTTELISCNIKSNMATLWCDVSCQNNLDQHVNIQNGKYFNFIFKCRWKTFNKPNKLISVQFDTI